MEILHSINNNKRGFKKNGLITWLKLVCSMEENGYEKNHSTICSFFIIASSI